MKLPKVSGSGVNPLPKNAIRAIRATRSMNEHDPLAEEALGHIIEVMRMKNPPRYVGSRLSAAAKVLAECKGAPFTRNPPPPPPEPTRKFLCVFDDGTPMPSTTRLLTADTGTEQDEHMPERVKRKKA